MSDQDFEVVRNAIYTHKVVVVKGQAGLIPLKQFEFVHRLDPDAEGVHGFDTKDVTDETIGVLGVSILSNLVKKQYPFLLKYHTPCSRGSTQSRVPWVSP